MLKNAENSLPRLPVEMGRQYKDWNELLVQYYQGRVRELPEKWEKMYRWCRLIHRQYDCSDEVFSLGSKQGVKSIDGEVIAPAVFDEVIETYDRVWEQYDFGVIQHLPVRVSGKCALVVLDGSGTLAVPPVYDKISRIPGTTLFFSELDGRKGVISGFDGEVVPCEMDEVFEPIDSDGVVSFTKNGKWGALKLWSGIYAPPVFDEMIIDSEQMVKVRVGNQWGWIDGEGDFTIDYAEAEVGSWYDSEK